MLLPRILILAVFLFVLSAGVYAEPPSLPGTTLLTGHDDFAKRMVEGIHAYLDRELAASASGRATYWHRDLGDTARYETSIAPNRDRFRHMIGLTDTRDRVTMRLESSVRTGSAEIGRAHV